jgi:FkbM family methyltransferase
MIRSQRSLSHIAKRLTDFYNYRAFFNFFSVHTNPIEAVVSEFLGKGKYPKDISIKTPTGLINLHTRSIIDFSTLNSIYCRRDYYVPNQFRTVIDIGSNVGFSTSFWLSRNKEAYVYAFEPNPYILVALQNNLAQFGNRYQINKQAVSSFSGETSFYVEDTGLYSSMDEINGTKISVDVIDINTILEKVIGERGKVDILKIDSEGQEVKTIQAINPIYWEHIECINIGDAHGIEQFIPSIYRHSPASAADRFIKIYK